MLLTLTTTHRPASDLGFLLHKHPARVQTFSLAFGSGHVFYPEAREECCSAVLLLDIDPIALVRGAGQTQAHYVNDRPYAASSFLSVAIAQIFGTAMAGRCEARPELARSAIPLTAALPVLPCRGGEPLLRQLFEPLGYDVRAEQLALDSAFPAWGDSDYLRVELRGQVRLSDLLTHLYVLVPVLDDDKHYWVGDAEVEKLLRRGEGWLSGHPARELIAARYLRRQRPLVSEALSRLDTSEPEPLSDAHGDPELPERANLHQQRLGTAVAALKSLGATRIVDLGCGEGRLLELLLHDPGFTELVGVDVSHRVLELAARRLRLETMPARKERVRLLQGALTYRDRRLTGFDAAALLEVIEHIEPARLPAVERALFEFARPGAVVLTTPNLEYNALYPTLPAGRLRHRDHRFEWTRAEFEAWVRGVCERNGYRAEVSGIGPADTEHGAPTQLAVFRRG